MSRNINMSLGCTTVFLFTFRRHLCTVSIDIPTSEDVELLTSVILASLGFDLEIVLHPAEVSYTLERPPPPPRLLTLLLTLLPSR